MCDTKQPQTFEEELICLMTMILDPSNDDKSIVLQAVPEEVQMVEG